MANRQRTYQWVNGQIRDIGEPEHDQRRPFKPVMGLQAWLFLFTLSSVLLVFAGLGLFAFCFAAYAFFLG